MRQYLFSLAKTKNIRLNSLEHKYLRLFEILYIHFEGREDGLAYEGLIPKRKNNNNKIKSNNNNNNNVFFNFINNNLNKSDMSNKKSFNNSARVSNNVNSVNSMDSTARTHRNNNNSNKRQSVLKKSIEKTLRNMHSSNSNSNSNSNSKTIIQRRPIRRPKFMRRSLQKKTHYNNSSNSN